MRGKVRERGILLTRCLPDMSLLVDESQKEVQKLYDLYDQDQNLRLSHSELHTMLHSSFGQRPCACPSTLMTKF